MNSNLIILPIIIPLITAVLQMFLWFRIREQRWIGLVGHSVSLVFALLMLTHVQDGSILTMQAGNWPAPYGIVFVVDAFSALMVLLTSISGIAVGIYSSIAIKSDRAAFGFFPLLQFLLMGLYGSFIAGDIFNLYVWFEVIIIASFVLITLGGEKAQLAGAMKYVTLNLLASVIFLTGIAVLYGVMGTLNLADLAQKIALSDQQHLINTIAVLFLVAFGIKSAVFPMYFWLPDAYHTPPAAISAIFGGLLTKVGVYAFIRIFSLLFINDTFIQDLLVVLAVCTMIVGALGAINARNIRIIFSYLIISHIGYMISGLGVFTVAALAGTLFYLIHDIIVKTNVFLISGLLQKIRGSYHIDKMGGLYNSYPVLSLLIALAFLSLVGTPPLSGFWPKVLLVKGAYQAGQYWVVGGILTASFLTLWAIVRIWSKAFWTPAAVPDKLPGDIYRRLPFLRRAGLISPIVGLLGISLFLGFAWKPIADLCWMIATQLKDPSLYIQTVLQ